MKQGFFRCRYTGCNEDYCIRCGIAADLDYEETLVQPIEENRALASKRIEDDTIDEVEAMRRDANKMRAELAMKLREKLINSIEASPEDFNEFHSIYSGTVTAVTDAARMTRAQVLKTCPKGCKLRMHTRPFPRFVNGIMLPGDNIYCFGLKEKIVCEEGYFRCEDENCNYDIC